MEQTNDTRRKHPRHKAPKGMFVAWRTAGQRKVSRAETLGLGGLFLHTPDPPSEGSIIELLFDLKAGEVRARAVVRHHVPGKGMGVQFVQMQAADRARLNQFLSKYVTAQPSPDAKSASQVAAAPSSAHLEGQPSPQTDNAVRFERELSNLLELARRGTYYQLLGVSADSTGKQVKQSFYALARKFHPDYHMGSQERMASLKELMGVATSAYKILIDDEKRARYDAQLATSGAYNLHRVKTASRETVEQCFARAGECLRAGNFVGSIVWLRKCVDMSPDEARYHALLARSLSEVGQYRNEAIEEFQRAIALDPWNTVTYMQFAELYESMRLPSRARLLYSKILEINPVHAKAQERLAQLQTQTTGVEQ